jgi:dynein heavy chain
MEHLKKDAKQDLNSLIDEMRDTVTELKKPAAKLDQLKRNRARYAEVRSKMDQLQARLNPIRQKFAYITDENNNDSNITELTEEEKMKLATLDEEWQKFQKGLTDANAIIMKNYQEHKTEMDNTLDDYKKEVIENKNNFKQTAPFSVEKGMETENERALTRLEEFKIACQELKQKEEDLKPGLDIFQYEAQNYPELKQVETENQLLTDVWELKAEFDNYWNEQKVIQFRDVNFVDIEQEVTDYYNKLNKMPKEIKSWPVFDFLRQKFTLYREVLPIGDSLKDEAIRPRHWNDIRFEVKEEF